MRTGFRQTTSLRNRTGLRVGQSIHLLQMTNLELSAAIETALQENPLLEVDESTDQTEQQLDEPLNVADSEEFEDPNEVLSEDSIDLVETFDRLDPNESIENEIEWDDQLAHLDVPREPRDGDSDVGALLENRAKSISLTDHLLEQLRVAYCSEDEAKIAETIFDWVNEDGFITLEDEDLLAEVQLVVACTQEQLEDVVALVQGFSPLGVCSRDLRECLMIQTRAMAETDACVPVVMNILMSEFDALARQEFEGIQDRLDLDDHVLHEAIEFIQHLNPRPAASFSLAEIRYIRAEARVSKIGDKWEVVPLDDHLPNIKISDWYSSYRSSMGRKTAQESDESTSVKDREYLRDCHSRAKLFLASLRFRNHNVMRILNVVVDKQQDFFEHGESAMKPLLLSDVAAEIGLHNSTVSRLTTGKYLETPRGVYELKYFFSNRVGNQPGKEHSGVAIRSVLKQLIDDEDPVRPLSDEQISKRLKMQNIEISRRTVTKYREALDIPPSKKRREAA